MLLEIFSEHSFCIYGAGIVAASAYTAIKALYHKSPLFFLISDFSGKEGILGEHSSCDGHSTKLDGIAIKTLSEWKLKLKNRKNSIETLKVSDMFDNPDIPDFYLIAVPEIHHSAIVDSLQVLDFPKIKESQMILFTNELENKLMETYYSSLSDILGYTTVLSLLAQSGQVWNGKKRCEVFQAKSHMDRPLNGQPLSDLPSYIHPIQAGAILTNQKIAALQDNQRDNISAKNRNYCELTATYYAWKNSHAAYKGICHYRRIFDISEAQMDKLLEMEQEWDVILPYPSIHYPNIERQHFRYLKEADWNAMLQALGEVAPDYMRAYKQMLLSDEQHFYNYNMLIAKAEVFDDYCSFLFKVLERAEALTTPKGWERADRFAGYMGENLTTIYFLKNKDKLKIAYVGKLWLT